MLGEHIDIGYTLKGPLPSGMIRLVGAGYQENPTDGLVRATVFLRPAAGGEQMLFMTEGADGPSPTDGQAGWLDAEGPITGPIGACGDRLVLRLEYVSGTPEYFIEYHVDTFAFP